MGFLGNFWRSTIGKKIVMAFTGLIGVGFVIGHMVGNLQVFEGAEKINAYGRFLHHTVGTELWLVRVVLLLAVILHVVAAVQLTQRANAARPVGYKKGGQREASTFASRTIRWGGFLILVFIVLHILHFTVRAFPGYDRMDPAGGVDVYANLVTAFSNPWWTLFYVVAMIALGLHLYHGFWSSLRTIGASKPSRHPLRRPVAIAIAVIVWAGFTIVPVAVYLGLVQPEPPTAAATIAPASGPASAPAPR
ncbi:MAG TPA: succinate dehydrogenase cytochrome b subunit [Gemmatimonadaceae bacterium]|jgi:succinate dehydrogenase / fumarate reductase cytochrome b subunit